jgi:hypothetical protein
MRTIVCDEGPLLQLDKKEGQVETNAFTDWCVTARTVRNNETCRPVTIFIAKQVVSPDDSLKL